MYKVKHQSVGVSSPIDIEFSLLTVRHCIQSTFKRRIFSEEPNKKR